MRVVVTGGNGQLGTDVTLVLQKEKHEVFSFCKKELDITNSQIVDEIISKIKPHVIVHTAAYTKVDQAEIEIDEAFRVNAIGTRNLAVAAEKIGAKIVYISTDYVFNGEGDKPYHEFMTVNPINIYGKSKYAGEQFVQQLSSKFFILRTSWVFGKHGSNFVKTMLKLAETRNELTVVHDQVGSPTYTVHLAKFIAQIINTNLYGVYHTSNTGYCSWYEFAKAIFEEAGLDHIHVKPVTTDQFPRPAARPANSRMDHMMIRIQGLKDFPHWRDALKVFFCEGV